MKCIQIFMSHSDYAMSASNSHEVLASQDD